MVKRILGKTETRRDPSVIPRSLSDELLRLIWRERCISRAEIARQTGLARSTVSEIVGGLLETGLVAEAGTGKSRGGRRPILLEFQDNACQILGVDIGAAHVAVALTDLRGRVLTWHESQHPVRTDPEGTRELVKKLCTESLASTDGKKRLIGIGVAMPSPVDPLHSELLSERVLPEWRGTSGLENLKKKFNVNVLIDNDANLGALAERWWGAGRNTDNFIYIKVATGIGAGLILGGEIYRGSTGVAGEIGHIPVDRKVNYASVVSRDVSSHSQEHMHLKIEPGSYSPPIIPIVYSPAKIQILPQSKMRRLPEIGWHYSSLRKQRTTSASSLPACLI